MRSVQDKHLSITTPGARIFFASEQKGKFMEEALSNITVGIAPEHVAPQPRRENQVVPRFNGKHGPLKNLFKPKIVKEIGVPLFQKLCERHSPKLYEVVRNFKANEANEMIESIRREDAPNPGQDFLNVYPWIVSLLDDEGYDLLTDAGAVMREDEHRGSFVTRVCLEEPDIFFSAAKRRRSTNAKSKKRYAVYRPSKPLNTIPIQNLTEVLLSDIARRCSEFFIVEKCGPNAGIWLLDEAGKLGILVDRGSPKKSKGQYDENERSITSVFRDEKTDVVFFDKDSQTLWIYATTKKMIPYYARLMGEYLFGDADLFTERVSFDMTFALSPTLKEMLEVCAGGRISAIRMKVRKIFLNDGTGVEIVHKRPNRADCVSVDLPVRTGDFRGSSVTDVTLEVELLSGTRSIFEKIFISNDVVQSGMHLSDDELRRILSSMNIFIGEANA